MENIDSNIQRVHFIKALCNLGLTSATNIIANDNELVVAEIMLILEAEYKTDTAARDEAAGMRSMVSGILEDMVRDVKSRH